MLIGELAEAVGLETQTIRFYERRGLLPQPRREANGYRTYDDSAVARVLFIRRAQAAGLTLVEILGIVSVRDGGDSPCAHVTVLLHHKLDAVRARQAELAAVETELHQLIERSRHLDPADCTGSDICHILAAPQRSGTTMRRLSE